jgi:CheY-like chemotaxis protein
VVRARRILVVDDLEHNRFLLEESLEGLGLEILTAPDGERALGIVETLHPEVVLLDFQMPGIDGAETARRIKKNEALPYTYVLLVSGYHEADLTEGVDRGDADRFLRKPYTLDQIRDSVREALRLVAERRAD